MSMNKSFQKKTENSKEINQSSDYELNIKKYITINKNKNIPNNKRKKFNENLYIDNSSYIPTQEILDNNNVKILSTTCGDFSKEKLKEFSQNLLTNNNSIEKIKIDHKQNVILNTRQTENDTSLNKKKLISNNTTSKSSTPNRKNYTKIDTNSYVKTTKVIKKPINKIFINRSSKSPFKNKAGSTFQNKSLNFQSTNGCLNYHNNINESSVLKGLENKLSKLIDMVVSFSFSMNNLRDNVYKKNNNILFNSKNDYNKLCEKLVSLSKELINISKDTIKYSMENTMNINNINNINNQTNININNNTSSNDSNFNSANNNSNGDIKNYKSTTENISSIDPNEIENLKNEIKKLKENNVKLTNKILLYKNELNKKNNIYNNEIYKKLFEENQKLKSEIITFEKFDNICNKSGNNYSNNNADSFNNEIDKIILNNNDELLVNNNSIEKEDSNQEIIKLKILIDEQKKEIENLKLKLDKKDKEIQNLNSLSPSDIIFEQLKEKYTNNINDIKKTFNDIINQKEQKLNKLINENKILIEERNKLKENLSQLDTDNRKQKILFESSLSKVVNEKLALELEIQKLYSLSNRKNMNDTGVNQNDTNDEKIQKLNNFIENQKIQIKSLNEIIDTKDKILNVYNSDRGDINDNNSSRSEIKKLKDEIYEKNQQISILTENHKNDLNELNNAIVLLKSQIAKLQEENYSYRDKPNENSENS